MACTFRTSVRSRASDRYLLARSILARAVFSCSVSNRLNPLLNPSSLVEFPFYLELFLLSFHRHLYDPGLRDIDRCFQPRYTVLDGVEIPFAGTEQLNSFCKV